MRICLLYVSTVVELGINYQCPSKTQKDNDKASTKSASNMVKQRLEEDFGEWMQVQRRSRQMQKRKTLSEEGVTEDPVAAVEGSNEEIRASATNKRSGLPTRKPSAHIQGNKNSFLKQGSNNGQKPNKGTKASTRQIRKDNTNNSSTKGKQTIGSKVSKSVLDTESFSCDSAKGQRLLL